MRYLLLLITFICSNALAQEQPQEQTINLNESAKLVLSKAPFNVENRNIEYQDSKWVIAIDGKPVFGTDGDMPSCELSSAILTIEDKAYSLDFDAMYNPWFGRSGRDGLFRLKKDGSNTILRGMFSDGAGAYGVEWRIVGNSSIRTIISKDEYILFEYFGF